ncbi:lipopolysaccharide biosynthesis protein [Pseudotenacibaculum sp. MALMAid0570]|uniref:lipopolysaccharide biosynthesis protein n=1 Tax=Pseudotenacibaculum sp. MALMAid0570 TaxID=3143938 RepID=UPI0032DF6281
MGIIFKQSFKNSLIIYLGFLIGGINTIIFYPRFLDSDYYGLVSFLLSASNLFMPLIALGIHFTIIKFFSAYKEKEERDKFMSIILFFPLFVAIPTGFLWDSFHDWIMSFCPEENKIFAKDYTPVIYIVALSCAYFEVFYAWAKVQLQSVFGNVLKEFWNRAVVMILLISVFFGWITKPEFIYILTGAYILRTLVMMIYAFKLYLPKFSFQVPENFSEVVKYSAYIILAGSAGAIILDIDKVMIPGKETFEQAAYYSVAVFIGSFIEAPSRAMRQILQPLTSKTLNENDEKEVNSLYKRSSINLLFIGGLFFLLINCGVHELFKLMPEGYSGGELVVLLISLVKLYHMLLGNNGDIINNSKFYRIILPLSVGMALSVYFLNKLFYFRLDYGTEGLAIATFLTIYFFNSIKLWFVYYKFKMVPFTNKTLIMLFIIAALFGAFYFWNFNFHPLINIALKSILITIVYLVISIRLKISPEINRLVSRFIKI